MRINVTGTAKSSLPEHVLPTHSNTFDQNVSLYEYWNQLENKMYYVNYRGETGDASQATQP